MDDKGLISLYTSFKDDSRGWLTLHRQHFTQFVAIILAVLGASVAAFTQLHDDVDFLLILAIGPFVGLVLSVFAVFVCNKFYKRYAEHDAVSYKLFKILEDRLDLRAKPKAEKGKEIFPEDQHLFPKRWTSRLDDAESVDKYANSRVWAWNSSNFLIIMTFLVLGLVNVVLILVIVHRVTP